MDGGTLTNRWAGATTRRTTRRSVLKAGAGLAAGAALAGRTGRVLAQDGGAIAIPPPRTQLPTENVTFRWVDSGDVKAFFWREFFRLYQEAHPNITMDYQGLPWTQIEQVVPLGVRNGNAPDVFQIPPNITAGQAASEGWGMALDDVVPDFAAWKAGFPAGSFVPGITDFDGKTYTMPLTSNRRHGTLLLYNRSYLEQAGLDPASTPFTWEQFRDAARVLTQQGNGEYYGLIFEGAQTARWGDFVANFGRRAGQPTGILAPGGLFDWKTNRFVHAADPFVAAVELLLALKDDGSIFPGSLSLNAPEARAQMTQGVAAMIIQGPWNIPQWKREVPDFAFGVAGPPLSAAGTATHIHVGPGGDNQLWVFADTPLAAVAGDILAYIGTVEGQTAWSQIVGVADLALFPEARAAAGENPEAAKALQVFDEQIRLGPDPRVRNPEVAQVFLRLRPVSPGLGEIVQGLYVGQIDDPRQALQDLQDASEAELDRAIGAAQAAGAQVTRDDFGFANWDPTRDYTDADYQAV